MKLLFEGLFVRPQWSSECARWLLDAVHLLVNMSSLSKRDCRGEYGVYRTVKAIRLYFDSRCSSHQSGEKRATIHKFTNVCNELVFRKPPRNFCLFMWFERQKVKSGGDRSLKN